MLYLDSKKGFEMTNDELAKQIGQLDEIIQAQGLVLAVQSEMLSEIFKILGVEESL